MQKRTLVLIIAAIVIITAFGAASHAKPKGNLAILVATDDELKSVMAKMQDVNNETKDGVILISGKIEGKPVILAKSDIGKINAAYTATLLFDLFKVDRLIAVGLAGSINPSFKAGSTFIASRVIEHDRGDLVKGLFIPDDTEGIDTSKFPLFNDIMKKLISKGIDISPATLLTGDVFISDTKKRNWLKNTLGGDIVDMEGYAIAKVCKNKKKDCALIKIVSDASGDNALKIYRESKETHGDIAATILTAFLK